MQPFNNPNNQPLNNPNNQPTFMVEPDLISSNGKNYNVQVTTNFEKTLGTNAQKDQRPPYYK